MFISKIKFKFSFIVIPALLVGLPMLWVWIGVPLKSSVQSHAETGKDYYLQVVTLEVKGVNSENKGWDEFDGTAPDLYFEVYWQDQRIFKSSVKGDSLLANWSGVELDLKNLALGGGKTSAEDVISAARISIKESDSLVIKVYDQDLLSPDDEIATLTFLTSDLFEGVKEYVDPSPSIVKIILNLSTPK